MRSFTRSALLSVLVGLSLAAAPASASEFGVAKWEAGTCTTTTCKDSGPETEFYRQAAGHPPYGITDFAFDYTKETNILSEEVRKPIGHVHDVRVDLPAGLAVDPEAVAQCPQTQIEKLECPESTQVGEDVAEGTAELLAGIRKTVTESFPVFNLERKPGQPARFGVEVKSTTLALAEKISGVKLQSAIYLEGGISWYQETETAESSGITSGDYHEFFEIPNIPTQPELVESRLIFWGTPHEHRPAEPDNTFITMPSATTDCSHPQTTYLHVEAYEAPNDFLKYANPTPVTATGCDSLAFSPSLALAHGAGESTEAAPDEPDGPTLTLHVPQYTSEPSRPDSPDVQTAEVTLPEEMTLNPSAAHDLQACTNEQAGLGTDAEVECPKASEIGTFAVDAPGVPNGSLTGSIYVASQEGAEPESGRELRFFLIGGAAAYGVGVRLEGRVKANSLTGQLTATVTDGPQVPFEDFVLRFRAGPRAPLANPLLCTPTPTGSLTPYSGESPTSVPLASPFAAGPGATCATSAPFSLAQTTSTSSLAAGAYTDFTFALARADRQQYLSRIKTILPAGLLGDIRSVPLCDEPRAALGTCASASQIGTATATVGAGSEPYELTGPVFLTGPPPGMDGNLSGAPYGLSIPIAAIAGPFDFGTVVTRATIAVDPHTARVIVTSTIPTIVAGVPVRLRDLQVKVDRPNFMFNPTSCAPLTDDSTLTSTFGAIQDLSSPLQVNDCSALPFKPIFKLATSAHTSKAGGASLRATITQSPHEANLHTVAVQLPSQLVSRLTTLQKACPEAVFAASPTSCRPLGAEVGTATVVTPILPSPPPGREANLSGSAYLVSHGGKAFPDLDLVLEGDGITIELTGSTDIKAGITSATFAAIPDAPISSFALDLPVGPHSALTANSNLCTTRLIAPTTIVAQSGAQVKQSTRISVGGCGIRILSAHVRGHRLVLRLRTLVPGRTVVSGHDLRSTRRAYRQAKTFTVAVPLSRAGTLALRRHRRLGLRVHVTFTPSARGLERSSANALVSFRR